MDVPIAVRRLSLCLAVSDLEAMAQWYAATFGFVVDRRKRFDAINATVAYLRCGDLVLELLQPGALDRHVRANPPAHGAVQGVSQLTFHVTDADATSTVLRAHGVTVAMAPVTDPDLGVTACFVRDPEGNLIELLEYDRSDAPGA